LLTNCSNSAHASGFTIGVEDGKKVGVIEGRALGLSNGLTKQLQLGRIRGKALIWQARLELSKSQPEGSQQQDKLQRIPLAILPRLERHIQYVMALTDSSTMDLKNEEASLDGCEEKLKKAKARATLIERMLGEPVDNWEQEESLDDPYVIETKVENIEDVDLRGARR
jgi:hypothetical protein